MTTEHLRAVYLQVLADAREARLLARVAAAEEHALAARDAADMELPATAFEVDLPPRGDA